MISQTAIGFMEQLAAEGVQSWLTADRATSAEPAQLLPYALPTAPGSVIGVALHGDVPPDPAAVRLLCERLGDPAAPQGGRIGHVSAPLDPALAHDTDGLVSASRSLRTAVGRENLMVQIPATEAGVEAITECLAHGLHVDATLICTTRQCNRVFDAFLAGMERALITGRALQSIRTVLSCPVDLVDGLAAPSVAGVATARLLYRLRERRLDSTWWQVLRAGQARPPTLLWTDLRPHHAARLVGWNTGMVFTSRTLEEAAWTSELAGDALLNRHREGERELARLTPAGFGRATADQAVTAELTRRRRAWSTGL
ncbi:transaldolase family protein [Streptomyces chattanoogensis]|uniref:transaldolase family protein n=1 Tax=Streptomyces chattanoogensis TaxID=66876 RepID=UPI0006B46B25|nr:transaldolase family protein [Streptomyces chattanoogensis]